MAESTIEEKMDNADNDAIHERNALLQKSGIEFITAFDDLCMGPPGDHCDHARKSLKSAMLALSKYKSTGETDGINAKNLMDIAKMIYKNCRQEKCDLCIPAYLRFKEYMKINNLPGDE